MNDLPIYLPPNAALTALTITSDFEPISEILQRAIVLLVCNDNEGLLVQGKRLFQFLTHTTTGGAVAVAPMLSDVADTLKSMLNDEEYIVSSVSFDVEVEDTTATVNLVIQTADNEQESMVVYNYE